MEHLKVGIIDQSKIWLAPFERSVNDSRQVINFNSLNGFKEKTTNIFKTTNRCTSSPFLFMDLKHQIFYKYCVLSCVHKLSNPLIIKKAYNNYCYMLFGVFKADCLIYLTVHGHLGSNFVVGEKCSHIHLLACWRRCILHSFDDR